MPNAKSRRHRKDRHSSNNFHLDGAYGTLFALLGLLAIARAASGAVSPHVAFPGDRIFFGPAVSPEPAQVLMARRVIGVWSRPGTACPLDLAKMASHPGALTVLAARPDGVVLSWAGGSTAAVGGCAGGSELLVSDADYQALEKTHLPKR